MSIWCNITRGPTVYQPTLSNDTNERCCGAGANGRHRAVLRRAVRASQRLPGQPPGAVAGGRLRARRRGARHARRRPPRPPQRGRAAARGRCVRPPRGSALCVLPVRSFTFFFNGEYFFWFF